jgi:hypothetical protein
LPPAERNSILSKVSAKANDPVVTEAIQDLVQAMDRKEERHYGYLYERIDDILSRSGRKNLQQHLFEIDSKLNRVAGAFLTPPDPALLSKVQSEMLRVQFLSQTDMAVQPLALTDSLQRELAAPRYARLRPLRSFQFPAGHYKSLFDSNAYFQIFKGFPVGGFVFLTLVGGALVLVSSIRNFANLIGVWYAWSMVATGFLMALGNCFSTSFGARYFLPSYSFVQIALMLLIAMLVQTFAERRRARSGTGDPISSTSDSAASAGHQQLDSVGDNVTADPSLDYRHQAGCQAPRHQAQRIFPSES